ncbi:hypothetical protein [Pedobacter sp. SL55]|uniref:hypothetical protein n=1 Tax=Pedobacter sp. SL55 TaxID=2995161 RepID=UPI002D1E44AF|nr:hypothetical protein [Pedobacter sp. SL55]
MKRLFTIALVALTTLASLNASAQQVDLRKKLRLAALPKPKLHLTSFISIFP